MVSLSLLFLITLFHLPFLYSSSFSQTLGKPDNFTLDADNNPELVPQSVQLHACQMFEWKTVGKKSESHPMRQPYFDNNMTNSPLVMTISNIPVGRALRNARLEFSIKALTADFSWDDGIGILFDEKKDSAKPKSGSSKVCSPDYFTLFSSFANATQYGSYEGQILNITWYLGNTTLNHSTVEIVQKISELGSFNILIGDDTSVDYLRFSYEMEVINVTTYSCRDYEFGSPLSVGSPIYSDEDKLKVTTLVDSKTYPFSKSEYLRTHSKDAGSFESVFQLWIENGTRFWLFVPKQLNLSWIAEGKWQPLEKTSGIISSEGQTYTVFTKRYEGGRWVVFGPSATNSSKTKTGPMYFLATAPASSNGTLLTQSNPAANCLCSSTGDPHYVTFDSRRFDFSQPGVYHLVKSRDCTLDVQTLTFKIGTDYVSANGIVGIRFLNDTFVLARQNATEGQLWTGHPKAYANGEFVNQTTTVGGMFAAKVTDSQWIISIPEKNFTLQAIEETAWFHLYITLGDTTYQRTVDGLCGNCDADPSNDFKYPNCQKAIESNETTLSASASAQWGMSWAASENESFTGPDKNTLSLGNDSFSACKASPLQPICPDLILTQHGNGVEPIPPATFSSCNGSTVVPVINTTIPDNPNVTDVAPCSQHPNYAEIRQKCDECFSLTGYSPESCLMDLCYGPESYLDYVCPGVNHTQCETGDISTVIVYEGYQWATLGDGSSGSPDELGEGQCVGSFALPPGWEIAPDGENSVSVIRNHTWATSCMVVSGGKSYPTAQVEVTTNPCFSAGLTQTGRCFTPKRCSSRILIRKPLKSNCGDGIKTAKEQCDDGNLVDGDGCNQKCKKESGWDCYNITPKSVCYRVVPRFICNLPADICSPCPYSAEWAETKTCCLCDIGCEHC